MYYVSLRCFLPPTVQRWLTVAGAVKHRHIQADRRRPGTELLCHQREDRADLGEEKSE